MDKIYSKKDILDFCAGLLRQLRPMHAMIIGALLLMPTFHMAFAQTVVWQLPPGDYMDMQRLGADLYKIESDGKVGLIKSDGSIVAPVENNELTQFYDNKALMLRNDAHGERVMGCLTSTGAYYPFTDHRYYTLAGQKFYSDGWLSVADEDGRVGYIDSHGTQKLGFDGRFDRIKPFVEGYAAVFKNKKYKLINKDGVAVRFIFNGVGEVFGGTNVLNGIVYVWDTDGKFYTLDVRNGGTCKRAKLKLNDKSFDYLYRFNQLSRSGQVVPYRNIAYGGATNGRIFVESGKMGYTFDSGSPIPAQFSFAEKFVDGIALVRLNGRTGLLRYCPGESFKINAKNTSRNFYGNESVRCEFSMSVPEVWRGKRLNIDVTDSNGNSFIVSSAGSGNYSFDARPSDSGSRSFRISVSADGLKLAENSVEYTFTKKSRCSICGKDKDKCSGHAKPVVRPSGSTPAPPSAPAQSKEKRCPTCGKPISACKYQGVH